MPVVAKLIFRLDCPYRYKFLDRVGEAIEIFGPGDAESFWKDISENPIEHQVDGKRFAENFYANLNMQPNNINGTIDFFPPEALKTSIEHEAFRVFHDAVKEYARRFEMKEVTRAGFRLLTLHSAGELSADPTARPGVIISESLEQAVAASLGKVTNSEATVHGRTEDGINFRLALNFLTAERLRGVYDRAWRPAVVSPIRTQYNLLVDIDLYETNLSFAEHTLYRWSQTKLAGAISVCDGLSSILDDSRKTSDDGAGNPSSDNPPAEDGPAG